jgi:hypothetical protein
MFSVENTRNKVSNRPHCLYNNKYGDPKKLIFFLSMLEMFVPQLK